MILAQGIIRPRASIFDPQGDAVQRAIEHLGVTTVKQAHVGKFIELEVESDDAAATRAALETICQDLLSNPVIEDFVLTLEGDNVLTEVPAPAKPGVERVSPVSETRVKTKSAPRKAAAKKAKASQKPEKKSKLTKAEKKAAKKAAKEAKKKAKKRVRNKGSKE